MTFSFQMAVFRSGTYNDSRFHGAKAALNTLNPKVDDDQSSMALIWVVSGVELITTGWAVSQSYKMTVTVIILSVCNVLIFTGGPSIIW